MKIVKKILIGILLLVVIILITALFVSKDMMAEREVIINKPKQEVFDYIKLLKNQNNYSKWATMDPAMKKEFRGTDGTVGFISAWDSDNGDVGKGEQEIKKIEEGKRINFELRFIKPFKSTAQAYMTTEAITETQTKIQWGFQGNMAYPFNIMKLFMNPEKAVGDDFSTGLNNLKAILEKQ
jgi:uncharacterized protein YndB with AHSA1/START domain